MKLSRDILPGTSWFLDYDGSLCPHQEVWEERAYDPEEIFQVVSSLHALASGVFWNTGRRPESLGGVHSGFLSLPGYFIHGSCYWNPPEGVELLGPALPTEITETAKRLVETQPELKLEAKPTSLRISCTLVRPSIALARALQVLLPVTPQGWHWVTGHRGIEMLANGFDKAFAIQREIVQRNLSRIPVAVGDDVLDRPAIEMALRLGGYAVLVGGSCGWITEIPHKAHQIIFCETPHEVLSLIHELST